MAELVQELRTKCTDDLHRKFHTFALADGKDAAQVLRELAMDYVAREEHAHMLRCRLLAGEGIEGESLGVRRGRPAFSMADPEPDAEC